MSCGPCTSNNCGGCPINSLRQQSAKAGVDWNKVQRPGAASLRVVEEPKPAPITVKPLEPITIKPDPAPAPPDLNGKYVSPPNPSPPKPAEDRQAHSGQRAEPTAVKPTAERTIEATKEQPRTQEARATQTAEKISAEVRLESPSQDKTPTAQVERPAPEAAPSSLSSNTTIAEPFVAAQAAPVPSLGSGSPSLEVASPKVEAPTANESMTFAQAAGSQASQNTEPTPQQNWSYSAAAPSAEVKAETVQAVSPEKVSSWGSAENVAASTSEQIKAEPQNTPESSSFFASTEKEQASSGWTWGGNTIPGVTSTNTVEERHVREPGEIPPAQATYTTGVREKRAELRASEPKPVHRRTVGKAGEVKTAIVNKVAAPKQSIAVKSPAPIAATKVTTAKVAQVRTAISASPAAQQKIARLIEVRKQLRAKILTAKKQRDDVQLFQIKDEQIQALNTRERLRKKEGTTAQLTEKDLLVQKIIARRKKLGLIEDIDVSMYMTQLAMLSDVELEEMLAEDYSNYIEQIQYA